MDKPTGGQGDDLSLAQKFDLIKDRASAAAERQYSYGKWVLASLLAVHAGGILAISQAGEARSQLYEVAGPYLIGGVALALIAGGLAWINFTAAAVAMNMTLAAMMKREEYEISRTLKAFVYGPFVIAPAAATASLICFLVAAWSAVAIL